MDLNRYRELRKHHTATRALDYARMKPVKPLDWEDGSGRSIERAEWKARGYTLIARIEAEDSPDTSHLGEIDSSWDRDAVKLAPSDAEHYQTRATWDVPIYFHPNITYREHFQGLRDLHYGRSEADRLAREYVRMDMQRLLSFHRNDWSQVGVVVTAYKAGIELGDASVWGIEYYSTHTPGFEGCDDVHGYLTETARELAHEALTEADTNRRRLCKRGKQ